MQIVAVFAVDTVVAQFAVFECDKIDTTTNIGERMAVHTVFCPLTVDDEVAIFHSHIIICVITINVFADKCERKHWHSFHELPKLLKERPIEIKFLSIR